MNDLSRCLDPLDMDATLIAVIEMSQSSWLVAGLVPGIERQPLKKLAIDERALLNLLSRFKQASQQYGLPIPKLQCIMMYSLVLLVGLPGNGRHMSEGHFHQANNPGWLHLTALHPSAVTRRT